MATWYRPQQQTTKAAPRPALKAAPAPAPRKPSWVQLRLRMQMADELLIGWVESIGTYEAEAEAEVEAPAPRLTAVNGTRIDAQFIAVNRTPTFATAPTATPARSANDAPLRLLQQLSLGSRYRLAAVVA